MVPGSAEEVAQVLAEANRTGRRVGPDFRISLERLNHILEYNAADLTVSAEAGVTLGDLDAALRAERQWLPLSSNRLTVGEVLLDNWSGPFRLFYGTARDMVLGVRFATVEGKLVKSGGKVVKNVAGYDMAKLMIGSCGTLAVLVQVNFRTYPLPAARETMAIGFSRPEAALAACSAIQRSVLTPLAMDLLDSSAAKFVSPQELPPGNWILAVAYGGVDRVIVRYRDELDAIGKQAGRTSSATLSGLDEDRLWTAIIDMPLEMEKRAAEAVRLKVTTTLTQIGPAISALPADAVVSRAGNGVTYFYVQAADDAAWVNRARGVLAPLGARTVAEYAPGPVDRWGPAGDDLPMMRELKRTFDPNRILYPGTFVGGL